MAWPSEPPLDSPDSPPQEQKSCDSPLVMMFPTLCDLKGGGRTISEQSNFQYGPELPLNPFIQDFKLSWVDKIRTIVLTVTVLPVRIIGMALFIIIGWVFATVGMVGVDPQKIKEQSIKGWRGELRNLCCLMVRFSFAACGFHWVNVTGKRASPEEAPIIVMAPHSTYWDALPAVALGAPSIVAKSDTKDLPFFGKFIDFTQPLYVLREDPNSRQTTIMEMVKRSKAIGSWRQILIFPEGTCTNRSCLLAFKPGAFIPGVPVQPVCVRYPNPLDTYTWSWEGPSVWKLFWLTLTQFHNRCDIEFLPVYHPSNQEQLDPKLFASNVRNVMASALNIPLTDYVYEDCRVLLKVNALDFCRVVSYIEVLRTRIGLIGLTPLENDYIKSWLNDAFRVNIKLDMGQLAKLLGVSAENSSLRKMHYVLDKEENDYIDGNLYAVLMAWLGTYEQGRAAMLKLYNCLDVQKHNIVLKEDLQLAMINTMCTPDDIARIFQQLDVSGHDRVTFDDFLQLTRMKPEYIKLFACCYHSMKKDSSNNKKNF